ncbi:MAG: hypothetical protein ABJC62_10370 [Frankiaceae bacterium]
MGAQPLLRSAAFLGLAIVPVRRGRVSVVERTLFAAVNGLPDGLHPALWLVMQSGALGEVPLTAALAAATGRRQLAARLAISGTTTYVLAKGIKGIVRRGRPHQLLHGVRIRGGEAGGPGFVSGHAGVSMSLGGDPRRGNRPTGAPRAARDPAPRRIRPDVRWGAPPARRRRWRGVRPGGQRRPRPRPEPATDAVPAASTSEPRPGMN